MRRWAVFLTASFALFMAAIESSIIATALPTVSQELGAGLNWGSWVVTIYFLGQTVSLPVAGRITDRFGAKPVFLWAAGIFTLASLGCGLAPSLVTLILFRAIQAVAGGAFMPCVVRVLATTFEDESDRAIGLTTTVWTVGVMVGPLLGGAFLELGFWRGVFLINVPLGLIFLVFGFRLPRSGTVETSPVDVLGAGLFGMTMVAALLAINELGATAPSPVVLCTLCVLAVGGLTVFLRRAGRIRHSIIPMALLGQRPYRTINMTALVYGMGSVGFATLLPLLAESRFDMSALESGTLLTSRAVVMLVTSSVTSAILDRTGFRRPMALGFTLLAASLIISGLIPKNVDATLALSIASGLAGLGIGIAVPSFSSTGLSEAGSNISALTGLRGMFMTLGATFGVSVTTVLTAQSSDEGSSLAHAFVAAGLVTLALLWMVRRLPERPTRRPSDSDISPAQAAASAE
ncbi:MFS transporter [Streptomyces fuscichromogenes]|uniref:MFS transporter n=2 Tax=Streptomyces fuscichromogenes TaxID=1324013 RepID=A0A917XM52_9ACTN|nr:MFS transporter [Streptomyces fuscichromogenes]